MTPVEEHDGVRFPDKAKAAVTEMFPPSFELGTFRVLGERDNHYTMETDGDPAVHNRRV